MERHGRTVECVAKLHEWRHTATRPALDRPMGSEHHKAGRVAHEEEQARGPQHQAEAQAELTRRTRRHRNHKQIAGMGANPAGVRQPWMKGVVLLMWTRMRRGWEMRLQMYSADTKSEL